jgi:7-carboxy-7-deazaguanine synthase
MSTQLIKAFTERKELPKLNTSKYLKVSEFYFDTIQGEGVSTGCPAAFLRLGGCHVNCVYCDTTEVWRFHQPYTFMELYQMMNESLLVDKLRDGQHLVITGGAPLLQQSAIAEFLWGFVNRFGFLPFVEIENECTIVPESKLIQFVNQWNNSPKLSSSGVNPKIRYRENAIYKTAQLENSWFKFVVWLEEEWGEIENLFLKPSLIKKNQIILMPLGATQKELEENRNVVVEMAVKHNVRYCTREHIVLWNKNVGV